ncbi:DegT/DnrJ/EryC1/StrS family aminotransferase [Streptomyces griseorubiginosus]|uniref:DegT/DnrJ/EryC1/StrS family aminotransferase n=1 Tax=Streptomyces griseorubiginosus TaxID=67304 RepID=UPI002E818520|nr:DegT/DnrJ/EryC1/StrS family aminotransferase [Streptomyces griseorubiginosus]WUB42919.1 DegT/DnrJ/EryC1/StrS family aminotransferase [Streptomyces griseorubiginosus]WUB51438.1 DegT/DnrJ/EryC1/StrS family aminotransferase [Streptomyces griseorubiginosus]
MTVHRLRARQEPVEHPWPPQDRLEPLGRGADGADEPDRRDVPFATTWISPEARRAAQKVFASGWVTTGRETERFEDDFAAYVSAAHAVAVSSCTAGLELAMRALGLPAGTPVLVPALTFCGAAQAILHAGLQPVLVDVDPGTGMPTPATVAAAAAACRRPGAMMVLHYTGAPAPVAELAEAAGLPLARVVEDAAHALGATVGERPVGSVSRATCFSFYATKNLPIGEGGMVTTEDPQLADRIRRARLHGMSADAWRRALPGGSWRYTVDEAGLKANMTDVQAAIGRAQLRHLDHWQERRDALAAQYTAALAAVPGLEPLRSPAPGRHARHLQVVRVTESYGTGRDELVERLAEHGIGTSVHFIPLHHMPYFRRSAIIPAGGLPGADALFPQLLSLPLYPHLPERSVDRVCAHLARHSAGSRRPTGLRTLVIGAGEAGRALARDLAHTPQYGLEPAGFLDDDPAKRRAGFVGGLPVLGTLEDTGSAVRQHRAEAVVVAIPGLTPARFRRVARAAEAAGASVRYLPSFIAALRRDVVGDDLRELDVRALIGRAEMHVVSPEAGTTITGRRVLVTGAGGSIGSELCHQVRAFGPSRLFLLDHDESNLHRLQLELHGDALHSDDIVISDIRDRPRIDQIFRRLRPEVVFHAAAHKHLPLLELHPCEGVKSNVRGTENLVSAAAATGTERFVLISTDKAADPVSVLGATKRLAELIVHRAQRDAPPGTVFAAVRFGNVLGSRGSLLSVVAQQLGAGSPVTVTHPDATRFFMTVEEAVGLVLEAARTARGGEVLVLDMQGPVRIVDLVRGYARSLHVPDVDIRYTGLRPGEKLNETLFADDEHHTRTAHPRILAVTSPDDRSADLEKRLPELYAAADGNDTDEVRRILTDLLPSFPASAPAPGPQAGLADPYPDDF